MALTDLEAHLVQLGWDLICGQFDASSPFFTPKGSFWSADVQKNSLLMTDVVSHKYASAGDYRSVVLLPLNISHINVGLLQLRSRQRNFFTKTQVKLWEDVVDILAITLLNQRARAACRERVKELTCLYKILKIAEQPEATLEQILQNIVELLPPAWQYPDVASARIVYDGRPFNAERFWDTDQKQSADIIVNDRRRGVVEVVYLEKKPELDEGPFLKE